MPYKSEKQRRYMHAQHPDIAARWDAEYGSVKRKKIKKNDDPFEIYKKDKKDHVASGSAIAGAGAVTATTGLVGGGIPGFRSNSDTIKDVRQGPWKRRTGAAFASGRGGVFGYRTDAHQGATNRFKADEKHYASSKPNRADSFMRGRGSGKIPPELKIIRHMKMGRTASNVALVGGTAATAYGVKRAKEVSKSERDTKAYSGALLGGGTAAAVLSGGGEKILRRQGRKWSDTEAHNLRQAEKLVPNMKPSVSDNEVIRNKKILSGKSKLHAEEAGHFRGHATQARYFSRVYNQSAKYARKIRNPAIATAVVGAGGLAMANKDDKVKKAMDPFEIEKAFNFKIKKPGMPGPAKPGGMLKPVPTAGRAQAAQQVMGLKGSGRKTLKAMETMRPKPLGKAADPFEIEKAFSLKGIGSALKSLKPKIASAGKTAGFNAKVGASLGANSFKGLSTGKKLAVAGGTAGALGAGTGYSLKKNDDPFEITKGEHTKSKASFGRHATARVVPGWHGAFAGKQGKKLRATGNELVGVTGGAYAGRAIGLAATRGNRGAAMATGLATGTAGGIAGVNRSQNRGYYKPEKVRPT